MDMDVEHQQRDLAQQVEQVLARDRHLAGRDLQIQVEARRDGLVVLAGQVKRLAEKRRAELTAFAVPGVRRVVNQLALDVYPTRSDSQIEDSVMDVLAQDPYINDVSVGVSVRGGEVTLTGQVPSLVHKRLAGVLVWWVPGVRDVANQIEVVPPEPDSDEQITEAVMVALDKDPLVDEEQVFVWTQGGVVKLSGLVNGEPQKEAAESDAWYVWGVREVVNELRVA